MACFHPMKAYKIDEGITFKLPKYGYYEELKIPCGKCIGCKLDHANDWATRCWCEMQSWKNNCFVTLTYNDENLPDGGYLSKEDIQKFLKRLRYYETGIEEWENPQNGKTEKPIRYLLCGEYGPNGTRRAHYHLLIFNWKPEKLKFYKENHNGDKLYTSKQINEIWGKGFATIGELNYKSACYVARYCTKKMFNNIKHAELKKMEIQPEFILMSRNGGIGIKHWKQYKKEILKREGILIKIKDKVKNKRIPKYYERKYKEENEKQYEKYRTKKILKSQENLKEILSKTTLSEYEYNEMNERKLIEKSKTLRRDNLI